MLRYTTENSQKTQKRQICDSVWNKFSNRNNKMSILQVRTLCFSNKEVKWLLADSGLESYIPHAADCLHLRVPCHPSRPSSIFDHLQTMPVECTACLACMQQNNANMRHWIDLAMMLNQSFKTMGTTHSKTHHHIPEDMYHHILIVSLCILLSYLVSIPTDAHI